jgi:hypothetical protein
VRLMPWWVKKKRYHLTLAAKRRQNPLLGILVAVDSPRHGNAAMASSIDNYMKKHLIQLSDYNKTSFYLGNGLQTLISQAKLRINLLPATLSLFARQK